MDGQCRSYLGETDGFSTLAEADRSVRQFLCLKSHVFWPIGVVLEQYSVGQFPLSRRLTVLNFVMCGFSDWFLVWRYEFHVCNLLIGCGAVGSRPETEMESGFRGQSAFIFLGLARLSGASG